MDILIFVLVIAAAGGAIYWRNSKKKSKPVDAWPKPTPKPAPRPEPHPVPEQSTATPDAVVSMEVDELVKAGNVVIEDLWTGLKERPAEDAPGWEEKTVRIAMQLPYLIKRWRDPETGQVGWLDYQPQMPHAMDFYYIASGARNVNAFPNWNGLWISADKINERLGERGLDRIRQYDGGLRSDPKHWPEPYRTAYLESH